VAIKNEARQGLRPCLAFQELGIPDELQRVPVAPVEESLLAAKITVSPASVAKATPAEMGPAAAAVAAPAPAGAVCACRGVVVASKAATTRAESLWLSMVDSLIQNVCKIFVFIIFMRCL
jgi:hypothetical protein